MSLCRVVVYNFDRKQMMDDDALIERLLDRGVLEENGGTIGFAPSFEDRRAYWNERPDEIGQREEAGPLGHLSDRWRTAIGSGFDEHPGVQATFVALAEALPELSEKALLRLLLVIDTIDHPPGRADGSPDTFLPLRGDRLPVFSPFIDFGAVYIWRESCEPCDVLREEFTELSEVIREDALLLSIYGPDSSAVLDDVYDVVGAPTTLFFANGRVDSRLLGAHPVDVIEQELRTAGQRAGHRTTGSKVE